MAASSMPRNFQLMDRFMEGHLITYRTPAHAKTPLGADVVGCQIKATAQPRGVARLRKPVVEKQAFQFARALSKTDVRSEPARALHRQTGLLPVEFPRMEVERRHRRPRGTKLPQTPLQQEQGEEAKIPASA